MDAPIDRNGTPISTFDGQGGGARPTRLAGLTGYDAFAGGQAAREIRPMDLKSFQLPSEFSTHRPTVRRSSRQEHTAMHPMHPTLMQTVATMRTQELQDEAARRRTLREARAARTGARPLVAVRQAVGAMLVRAGERVQGVERATARPAAGDLTVAGTHLRLVR